MGGDAMSHGHIQMVLYKNPWKIVQQKITFDFYNYITTYVLIHLHYALRPSLRQFLVEYFGGVILPYFRTYI